MSIRMMAVVWELDLPPTEKLVLLIIADHADDNGQNAYPGIARIARRASLSERQVQRILSDLVKRNLLVIDRQRGGGVDLRSDRRPNRYAIVGVTSTSSRGVDGVTFEGLRGDISALHGVTPMSPNPSIEQPIEHSGAEVIGETFERFWNAYPRKVGKRDAKMVFVRMMRRNDAPPIDDVLGAVAVLVAENREMRFIPHPATWLRQGRWEDEVPTSNATAQESAPVEAKPFCGECRSGWRISVEDGVERYGRCDCQR